MMLENKLLNDESLELNIEISWKNLQVSTHLHKMTESECKNIKTDIVWYVYFSAEQTLYVVEE